MRAPLAISYDELVEAAGAAGPEAPEAPSDELRRALAELPEQQREAVVLRDVYGLRYREVAVALGLSRPAVESVLFRARRRLRTRLRPVAGALVVPSGLRDALDQALPGFAAGEGSATVAGAAGATGVLVKLGTGSFAAKLAAGTVVVGAGGGSLAVGLDVGEREQLSGGAAAAVKLPASRALGRASTSSGVQGRRELRPIGTAGATRLREATRPARGAWAHTISSEVSAKTRAVRAAAAMTTASGRTIPGVVTAIPSLNRGRPGRGQARARPKPSSMTSATRAPRKTTPRGAATLQAHGARGPAPAARTAGNPVRARTGVQAPPRPVAAPTVPRRAIGTRAPRVQARAPLRRSPRARARSPPARPS